jgi:hypothetical protein
VTGAHPGLDGVIRIPNRGAGAGIRTPDPRLKSSREVRPPPDAMCCVISALSVIGSTGSLRSAHVSSVGGQTGGQPSDECSEPSPAGAG